MQGAGAQAIMPWSVNAGFLSRILNTRGAMAWDVPVVGQTTLGSGQTKALLEKPEYWNKVYSNNFRNCCYVNGKLPPRAAGVRRAPDARPRSRCADTLLWWIALGWDGATADGRDASRRPAARARADRRLLEQVKAWPGIYGTVTWTPQQHNGFQDNEVVMCRGQLAARTAPSTSPPATAPSRCCSRSSPTAWR